MTLLFITQKLHEQDAFVILWVRAFIKRGYNVKVLCLENRVSVDDFEIYSMGKEVGRGKFHQIIRFWRFIVGLKYDAVFIHMAPVYGALGSWWWSAKRIPVYLWYTHYKRSFSMRIVEKFAKKIFCATSQSVPWIRSDQKVVLGHGIDLNFWKKRKNITTNPKELLVVHRLSRSKRLEIGIRALKLLPDDYAMVIYGIEAEKDYVSELHKIVNELNLRSRVVFRGTIPMNELPSVYASHRLILNMASETIDKTMLEAMTCGCYPVTTKANAKAIGIDHAPGSDAPEAVAEFVSGFRGANADELYKVIEKRHSLDGMVGEIDRHVRLAAQPLSLPACR